MRYFARISYNGTKYYGWQKQSRSDNTVQHLINQTLSILLKHKVETMGCGRTDSGVHAKDFILHFDSDTAFTFEQIIYKCNQILPADIVMHDIFVVKSDAHARFHAKQRSYNYRIKTYKDPFDNLHYYYRFDKGFDFEKLREIAALIPNYEDFSCYCKSKSSAKTRSCKVKECYWIYENGTYEFRITANRFLRGMIRLLVGMMLNYQAGKLSKEEIIDSFELQKPLRLNTSVEANGLLLFDIKYNDEDIFPK